MGLVTILNMETWKAIRGWLVVAGVLALMIWTSPHAHAWVRWQAPRAWERWAWADKGQEEPAMLDRGRASLARRGWVWNGEPITAPAARRLAFTPEELYALLSDAPATFEALPPPFVTVFPPGTYTLDK